MYLRGVVTAAAAALAAITATSEIFLRVDNTDTIRQMTEGCPELPCVNYLGITDGAPAIARGCDGDDGLAHDHLGILARLNGRT